MAVLEGFPISGRSSSPWDLRLQLFTKIAHYMEIDLAGALVPYHQKAHPIRRDVVRGMTSSVCLVWAVEEDLRFSHPSEPEDIDDSV